MFRFPWSGRSPKSPRFTDEQIRAKVYELWKARGYVGCSPDEDRLTAIALLAEESGSRSGRTPRLDVWGHKDDREFALKVRQFHWERIKTIISAFGLGATAIAAIGLFINYRQGEERLVTERFAKAVEQLGSKEITVRIGSIYALERIAKDSPKDHWTVMEVLTAFVRERSPNKPPTSKPANRKSPNAKEPELPGIPTDVQSTLTAIERRDASKDPEEQTLNLRNTYLVGASLFDANLREASLYNANLQGTSLYNVNLQGANLSYANLQGADLSYANLQEASLSNVNLQGASLPSANLRGASLFDANLREASLSYANLRGASLFDANLREVNLYDANLQGANLSNVNLQGADLSYANLQEAILPNANLQKANLFDTNLQWANLYNANLQWANLYNVNLQRANLDNANLQAVILLATDLRETKGLTKPQLEGVAPPLLCNVALPKEIKVNPNRDCDRLPQELVKWHPSFFPTLKDAKTRVDEARKQKWK